MQKFAFIFKVILLCLIVIWGSVELWSFKQFLTAPISSLSQPKIIEIPKGVSTKKVAEMLHAEKLIRHPIWLRWYLKVRGKAQQIQAGEFEISPAWTVSELTKALVSGKTVSYPVTFIAGETFKQSFNKLKGEPKLKHLHSGLDTDKLKALLDIKLSKAHALEGQLLPETYLYSANDTDESVLLRAHEALQKVLLSEWQTREKGLPLKTPYDALILASIVEKETGSSAERPMIAGVFVNRLKKGMRLQSDPTVIYGIGDAYDGDIRKKDLLTKTAYNTYRINGLPPTPIALASRDAIKAVMHPAKTKALYFVATGKNGEHKFSNTLKEHNRAVRAYLNQQKLN